MFLKAECMGGNSNNKKRKNKKEKSRKKKKEDLYRDTNFRYMGYANEIGESLRAFIGRSLVTVSYALASAYVIMDVGTKSAEAWKTNKSKKQGQRHRETIKSGADAFLWQSFASIIVPGFVINRLNALTRFVVCRTPMYQFKSLAGAASTLAAIPFMVEPIDKFVDGFMNDYIRPIYNRKNKKNKH